MDIWEANSQSQAYTLHPCSTEKPERCEDPVTCGGAPDHRYDGVCDKDGCDFATYRFGDHKFYGMGEGFTVDTSRKFTVVTQFITHDGTDNGDVVEVKRKYVQDGKVIDTPKVSIAGKEFDSITDVCNMTYALTF